jgi:hypothetical protein
MPKQETPQHFDAEGIVTAVHQQDIGLRVTTNQPEQFRQLVYRAAARLGLKVHIYAYPARPNSFALLKEDHPNAS